MPNLTNLAVRTAAPPPLGTVTLWDASLKNFGLRISQGGTKTWIVLVASGRRHSIGHYPAISLADARKEARRILAEKELGRVRPTRTAFDDAVQSFLADAGTRCRPRTVRDYTRLLKHLSFGRTALAEIAPRIILKQLTPLPVSEKHHAFTAARAFFRWCVQQHLIDRSPVENIVTPQNGKPRERVLTEQELTSLLRLLSASRSDFNPFYRIVELLILTGQRRGEIAALQWEWINEQERSITFPSTITKNGRTHTIPYGDIAGGILAANPRMEGCPYVFPAARKRNEKTTVFNGWGKPKAALDMACGVTDWTLHDLRRTYSSTMAYLGVPQVVVEKLLNHVSGGTLSPIASVYNRHAYMNEMRDAVLRYEAYLTTLIAPTA